MRARTFPVAETDGEVSLRFQAHICPRDQRGLERGRVRMFPVAEPDVLGQSPLPGPYLPRIVRGVRGVSAKKGGGASDIA